MEEWVREGFSVREAIRAKASTLASVAGLRCLRQPTGDQGHSDGLEYVLKACSI